MLSRYFCSVPDAGSQAEGEDWGGGGGGGGVGACLQQNQAVHSEIIIL